jgi:hypothetical protein
MNWAYRPSPLMVWAARELLRRPVVGVLLFAGLSATVALVGVLLLYHQSVARTCTRLLNDAPSVVVRRVDAGGWAPMPIAEGQDRAVQVPGVLRLRARVWGVVLWEDGSGLTVVGRTSSDHWPDTVPPPQSGQAVLGPGIGKTGDPDHVILRGRVDVPLKVIGRLPVDSGLAVYDVAVVHADDARRLLGLAPGQASDLALDVFRPEEVEAVCRELAGAFPWPVRISTRQSRMELCLGTVAGRTGIGLGAFVPALLAVACLVMATGVLGGRRRREMGLLKALGWTGADIFRMQAYGLGLLAAAGVAAGLAAAYGLLYVPGMTQWLNTLYGWSGPAVLLAPTPAGLLGAFGMTVLLVAVPFVAAGLWAARDAALADPGDLLQT